MRTVRHIALALPAALVLACGEKPPDRKPPQSTTVAQRTIEVAPPVAPPAEAPAVGAPDASTMPPSVPDETPIVVEQGGPSAGEEASPAPEERRRLAFARREPAATVSSGLAAPLPRPEPKIEAPVVEPRSPVPMQAAVANALPPRPPAAAAPLPRIEGFTSEPAAITAGGKARLVATYSGEMAIVEPDVGRIVSGRPVDVSPATTTTYAIKVRNAAGDEVASAVTVKVVDRPVIHSFAASRSRVIAPGQFTRLAAAYSNGTGFVEQVSGLQSGGHLDVAPRSTTTWKLTVKNELGATATADVRVEVAGLHARLLLLPFWNLSGGPAPLRELRMAMARELIARGIAPLDDATTEAFLLRHRIRYMGGVDRETADAAAQEIGADGILLTSIDLYDDSAAPGLSVSMRLVAPTDAVEVLWIDGAGHVSEESPGFLDLGVMREMAKVRDRTLGELAGSLRAWLVGEGPSAHACEGAGRFDPQIVLGSPRFDRSRTWTVAVLPFANQSLRRGAGDLVAQDFVRNLAATSEFRVVEPGRVREELLRYRIILEGGLSLDAARVLGEVLQVDLLLTGTVRDYSGAAGVSPRVEFTVLGLDRAQSEVLWQSTSWHHGDDGVFFFDAGYVASANRLACRTVRSTVEAMVRRTVPATAPRRPTATTSLAQPGG